MGDRITIYDSLKCAYCGKVQEEVYYAESSNFTTHKCEKCGKENLIAESYKLIKKRDETTD